MNKLKIKVIKKNEAVTYVMPSAKEKTLKQKAERQMASNVSGWINDLQRRRREESKLTFNQLFALQN